MLPLFYGPFWQRTPVSIPIDSPDYRGSFVRIKIGAQGYFGPEILMNNTGGGYAPGPGGAWEGIFFSDIPTILNPDQCNSTTLQFVSDDGSTQDSHTTMGASGQFIDMLSSAIGNVAQQNAVSLRNDFIWAHDSAPSAAVQQHHSTTPIPGITLGPLRAESWAASCPSWTPNYIVRDRRVTNDAQLVGYPNSMHVRCFISGLEGAWSSTRDNGYSQPYAQIYTGSQGELRMRVLPSDAGMPADRVAAWASCIWID